MIPRSLVKAPQTFKAANGPFWDSASPPVDWGQGKEAQQFFIIVCFKFTWTLA